MARVVAALDGGDSLDNEIYAQKCAAALEALEAELADQDRRFATIRETLSLTAESLEALSGAEDATLPPDVLARLDEKTDGLEAEASRALEREAAVDDLIAAARAEAARAGVGGLELEDDDGGAAAAAAVDAAIRDHVTVAMRSVADVAEARLGRVPDQEQRRRTAQQQLTPLLPLYRRAPPRLNSSASTFSSTKR